MTEETRYNINIEEKENNTQTYDKLHNKTYNKAYDKLHNKTYDKLHEIELRNDKKSNKRVVIDLTQNKVYKIAKRSKIIFEDIINNNNISSNAEDIEGIPVYNNSIIPTNTLITTPFSTSTNTPINTPAIIDYFEIVIDELPNTKLSESKLKFELIQKQFSNIQINTNTNREASINIDINFPKLSENPFVIKDRNKDK